MSIELLSNRPVIVLVIEQPEKQPTALNQQLTNFTFDR